MSEIPAPCACMALRKATRAVSRFYDEALAPAGVTITQFSVLRTIARLGDPPLSRLAEALVMDRTSLYRTLQPMIRVGWIAVEAGKGRNKLAVLRPPGRAQMDRAAARWEAAQETFLQRFGADAWRAVDLGLHRAVEIAQP